MSLQLYFGPGACSFVPHTLLELSGAAYEPVMVKLHKGEQHGDAFKALNPRGQVPVLVHNGEVITQILAIIHYLDHLFPDNGFLPVQSVARAHVQETLAWMNNTVHPTFTHIFMPQKFTDDVQAQAVIKAFAIGQYRTQMLDLQSRVQAAQAQGKAWLGGARMGPLDTYALTLTRWSSMAGINPDELPRLWHFVQQVAAHEAVARVIERERLVLNLYKPA